MEALSGQQLPSEFAPSHFAGLAPKNLRVRRKDPIDRVDRGSQPSHGH